MFSSPTAATPFGKARTPAAASMSMSMSFGQQSAMKRKREHVVSEEADAARNTLKYLRKDSSVASLGDDRVPVGCLYGFGQLLVQNGEGQRTFLIPAISRPHRPECIALTNNLNFNDTLECGAGPSDSIDIISCSHDGAILLINVPGAGTQITLSHRIRLRTEDERITAVCHAGNVVIVGTSTEDLYLVRRYGRTLNADLLQRDRSLFTNLLASGARLIGIAPTPSSDAAVVKLIPVPLSFLLLSVSQKSITAWSDWTNPGEESTVWVQGIRELLGSDISNLGGSEGAKVEVVDAALMHVELGAEQATLLVLSAQSTGSGNDSTSALWLHTLEIQLATGAQTGGGHQSPVRILHRTRLSQRATFYTSPEETRPSDYVAPTLAAQPPSWRVFVAWTEAPASSGDDYENADVTLHGVQIDVLNQPLLNATSTTGGQRDQRALREESIQCRHAQDSKLPVSGVLAVSAVKGIDGLCVVKTDGSVLAFIPPLPARAGAAFPVTAAVRDRHAATTPAATTSAAGANTSAGAGEAVRAMKVQEAVGLLVGTALDEDRGLGAVMDVMSACSEAEVARAVMEASGALLSRSAAGEHWGASGAGSAALTRFQLVHRLVESKLAAHKRLLGIVASCGVGKDKALQQALDGDHQKMLFCAGLSGAVEECQVRFSAASHQDAHDAAQHAAAQEALRIVAVGLERAVVLGRGRAVESIEAQGLSVADVFYAESQRIYSELKHILQALRDGYDSLVRAGRAFSTTVQVASLVLSAVQLAEVGDGAQQPSTSAVCAPEVRNVIASLIDLLLDAAQLPEAAQLSATAARKESTAGWPGDMAGDREGKRVRELCATALSAFLFEASQVTGRAVEEMPQAWKTEYHALKKASSDLLLSLGQAHATFALCAEHLYCDGLMESAFQDPRALLASLEEVLRQTGAHVGTDTRPLATACFEWLEERQRPADILSLGETNRALLQDFLKTRPSLAWMHHLRSENFSAATVAAAECTTRIPQVAKATTLLSIAKLSAKLAQQDVYEPRLGDAAQVAKVLFMPSVKADQPAVVDAEVFERAVDSANADLAVLKAQGMISSMLPNANISTELRCNVTDLVSTATKALRHHGQAGAASIDVDPEHPLHCPDPDDPPRCFGSALGLLSMQMDVVDRLVEQAQRRLEQSAGEASLEQQLAADDVARSLEKAQHQREALRTLLVALWAALIAANTPAWLELACYPSLGAQEEAALKEGCWLYTATVEAAEEAAEGVLRSEVVLNAADDNALLEQALAASGVTALRLEADGERHSLPVRQVNSRVVHVVKVCVGMALADRKVSQQ